MSFTNSYYVATFIIPKGSQYAVNWKGEIISNQIIYTGKHLKQIIIAVLCVLLIGGGLSAVMLRTQIGEVVTTVQKWDDEEGDKSEKHKDTREEQDGEKFNSQFENDYEIQND